MEIDLQLFFFQYATKLEFVTIDGQKITFLNGGIWNLYDGPDFLDVTFTVNNEMFTGAVEIHSKASDWKRHGHQDDPNYQSVKLHFVGVCDTIIEGIQWHVQAPAEWKSLPISKMDVRSRRPFDLSHKLNRIYVWDQRFGREGAAFIHVARALGRYVQGEAMELLAMKWIPWMHRQNWNARDTNILMHGLAGHLNLPMDVPFYQTWKMDFENMGGKTDNKLPWNKRVSLHSRQWLKVSQFAHLCWLMDGQSYADLMQRPSDFNHLLQTISGLSYWENHYSFGQEMSHKSVVNLTANAQWSIFKNTIPIWELAF